MCRWLHRFNAAGLGGLGDRPGAGRKRRITEAERSAVITLARSVPPGRLARDGAGELSAEREDGPAHWTLDTLAQVARDAGIEVGRSQVRRILLAEKASPEGTIWVITGNLSSHDSKSTRAWLEDRLRIRHALIPKRACWLNLQEGWWRIFRRQAVQAGVKARSFGKDMNDPERAVVLRSRPGAGLRHLARVVGRAAPLARPCPGPGEQRTAR